MRLGALLVLRLLWLTAPLSIGPAVEDALRGVSTPVAGAAAVGLWGAWAAGLLALLVPRVLSLTVVRVVVPTAFVVAVASAATGGVEAIDLVAVVASTLIAVVALWPTVGDELVDGSSYGPERRLPLRVPPAVALGPAPLTVAVLLVGVATGPLLLAAGQWVAGAVLLVIGFAAASGAARSLHALARRFLVFVPGGLVIHDPLTLVEPVLLPKAALASVGPAPADTDATDLTLGAGGLVMELRLHDPSDLVRRVGRGPGQVTSTAAVLVTPTRTAAFLSEARDRRLPVP